MLLQCLECNYKCGNIAVLKYHYESFHKDKTDKSMFGNILLSGICANDFSPWGCSLKNESNSSSNSNSNSNSNTNSISSSNPSSNSSANPSSSSGSGSIYDYNSNSDPNLPNPNPSSEVIARCCNKCNFIKTLNNFDEGKYTCTNCTSAKVSCPYCASVVRYDGIQAPVKKQHPDVELTRGFSRNLGQKTINPSWHSKTVSPLHISQTEESCWCNKTEVTSCKYYKFVSFLIDNGINIEKIKENINLLKSIDNLK